MISVVYGASFAVAAAAVWMTVPWRQILPGRRRHTAAPTMVELGNTVAGDGFNLEIYPGTEVASIRHYANGSTRVWLKRDAK